MTTTRKGKELSYGLQNRRFYSSVVTLDWLCASLIDLDGTNALSETNEAVSEIIDILDEIQPVLWALDDMIEEEGELKEQHFLDAYEKFKKYFLEVMQ